MRIVKWAAVCCLAIVLLMGLAFAALQTDRGKRLLITWIAGRVSPSPDLQVTLEGLDGLIPFSMRLRHGNVSDSQGEWLRVDDLTLRWSPLSLIGGTLRVEELIVGTLRLERIPSFPRGAREQAKPPLPPSLPRLDISELLLREVFLGEPVVGKTVGLTVRAGVKPVTENGLSGSILIERIDNRKARVDVSWKVMGPSPVASITAIVEEDSEGLLAHMAGIRGYGPLHIELTGEGPPDSWEGRLRARAEKAGTLEARLQCAVAEEFMLRTQGVLQIDSSARMPSRMMQFRGLKSPFVLELAYRQGIELRLDRFETTVGASKFVVEGRADFTRERLSGRFTAECTDLSTLTQLIGGPVKGEVMASGAVSGPWREVEGAVSLSLSEAAIADVSLSRADAELSLRFKEPWSRSSSHVEIVGKGTVDGFRYPAIEKLPEGVIQWKLSADVPQPWRVRIREFTAQGKGLDIRLSGEFNGKEPYFKGNLDVNFDDLGNLSRSWGVDSSGSLHMVVRVDTEGEGNGAVIFVNGRLRDMGSFPSLIGGLVQPEVAISSRCAWRPGGIITIERLELSSPAMACRSTARIDAMRRTITGEGTLTVPDLARVRADRSPELSGAVSAAFTVSGPMTSPRVSAKVEGVGVRYASTHLDAVTVNVTTGPLARRCKGSLEITGRFRKRQVQLKSLLALSPDEVTFSNVTLVGDGMRGSGDLVLGRREGLLRGTLEGRIGDLSALSAWVGDDLEGELRIETRFSGAAGLQGIAFILDGRGIQTIHGQVDQITVSGQVADLLGERRGSLAVQAKKIRRGALSLGEFAFRATGSPTRAEVWCRGEGRYGERFSMETGGVLEIAGALRKVQVVIMEARYGSYPLTLLSSVGVGWSKEKFEIGDVRIRVGPGTLRGSGNVTRDHTNVAFNWESIPLDVLGMIGVHDVSGWSAGDVRLFGKSVRSEGRATVSFTDVRMGEGVQTSVPSATVGAEARLDARGLRCTMSFEGMGGHSLEAFLQIPMTISIVPLEIVVAPAAVLRGRVEGTVMLDHLPVLLGMEDHVVAGEAMVAAELDGTVADPLVRGEAFVVQAAYDNLTSGTHLRDIEVRLRAEGSTVYLERFRTTDGEKGTISATGRMSFTGDFPVECDMMVEDAVLIRSDSVRAQFTGDFSCVGSLADTLIRGRVTAAPVELRIPDGVPADIVPLEVREINVPSVDGSRQSGPGSVAVGTQRLDISINLPGRVFLRGYGLESEWRGALQVGGTRGDFRLTGSLDVVRGHYDFFGKRFKLMDGSVAFAGQSPPSPDLDLSAEYTRGDVTARLRMVGGLSSVNTELESDPPLPEDEIMARVLFGRDAGAVSPLQAIILAQGLQALRSSGGGPLDFMDRTRRFLSVERLDVQRDEESEVATLTVGKYLTEDVYLQIDEPIGTEVGVQGARIAVEVDVTRHISVESETGLDGEGGLGLNWKWNY